MPLSTVTRRTFLKTGTLAGAAALVPATATATRRRGPVVIASANGGGCVAEALRHIQEGADALDAVVAGVNLVEEDPNDTSVATAVCPMRTAWCSSTPPLCMALLAEPVP